MKNQCSYAIDSDEDDLPETVAEFHFYCWKRENQHAVRMLTNEMFRRQNEDVWPEMITQVSLARYFNLIEGERRSMAMYFTEEELYVLLSVNPQRWWTGLESSLATAVFEHHGLDENADKDSVPYRLCVKLSKLSALQATSLIELLECAWRDDVIGPVAHVVKEIGSAPLAA